MHCSRYRGYEARGFTLLEVVVGLILMATVLVGALLSYSSHQRQLAFADKRIAAVSYADEILARLSSGQRQLPKSMRGAIVEQPNWYLGNGRGRHNSADERADGRGAFSCCRSQTRRQHAGVDVGRRGGRHRCDGANTVTNTPRTPSNRSSTAKHRHFGFTLIELVASLVLASMMMVALINVVWSALREMNQMQRAEANRFPVTILADQMRHDFINARGVPCRSGRRDSARIPKPRR